MRLSSPRHPQDGSPQEYTVFDPCIWKNGDYYYSLSAGMLPEGPAGKRVAADFLFRSKDLATWEYLHPFTEDDRFTLVGDDGACPYFWPIGDKLDSAILQPHERRPVLARRLRHGPRQIRRDVSRTVQFRTRRPRPACTHRRRRPMVKVA